MRLWNLSEFPELGSSVLLPYGDVAPRAKSRAHHPKHKLSRFKVALTVTALTASFSVGVIQANSSTVSLPPSIVSLAQSVAEPSPPLDGFFGGRFNAEWKEDLETELLMRVESGRLQGTSSPLMDQTIDVVFSNQFEDLSEVPNRLSREQIAALAKSRKLQR